MSVVLPSRFHVEPNIPATLDGLWRHGTPYVRREGLYDVRHGCYCVDRNADGVPVSYSGPRPGDVVPLLDSTGQYHALLWLAERVGLDASGGVAARYEPHDCGRLILINSDGHEAGWGAKGWGNSSCLPLATVDPEHDHALPLAIQAVVLHLAGVTA